MAEFMGEGNCGKAVSIQQSAVSPGTVKTNPFTTEDIEDHGGTCEDLQY
jgi:hypothetical protein